MLQGFASPAEKNLHPAETLFFQLKEEKRGSIFSSALAPALRVYRLVPRPYTLHFALAHPAPFPAHGCACILSGALPTLKKSNAKAPSSLPAASVWLACSTRSARPVALVPRASSGRLPSCSQRLAREGGTRVKHFLLR